MNIHDTIENQVEMAAVMVSTINLDHLLCMRMISQLGGRRVYELIQKHKDELRAELAPLMTQTELDRFDSMIGMSYAGIGKHDLEFTNSHKAAGIIRQFVLKKVKPYVESEAVELDR